jgi:uncharacterized membrane protein
LLAAFAMMTAVLELYLFLKYLHVLMAVVAVGFNASYPIWFARARTEPGAALTVLRGIKTLDDRFANPAYGLLLVLGLAMVFIAGIPLTTFWIGASLALYVLLVLIAVIGYSPTLKGQIAALEAGGPDAADYLRLSRRATIVGLILMLDVLVIVFFMVTKPNP